MGQNQSKLSAKSAAKVWKNLALTNTAASIVLPASSEAGQKSTFAVIFDDQEIGEVKIRIRTFDTCMDVIKRCVAKGHLSEWLASLSENVTIDFAIKAIDRHSPGVNIGANATLPEHVGRVEAIFTSPGFQSQFVKEIGAAGPGVFFVDPRLGKDAVDAHIKNTTRAPSECASCGAYVADPTSQRGQCVCSEVRYCGPRCQKEQWPTHKQSCSHGKKGNRGAIVVRELDDHIEVELGDDLYEVAHEVSARAEFRDHLVQGFGARSSSSSSFPIPPTVPVRARVAAEVSARADPKHTEIHYFRG